jgi:hypothetical protein
MTQEEFILFMKLVCNNFVCGVRIWICIFCHGSNFRLKIIVSGVIFIHCIKSENLFSFSSHILSSQLSCWIGKPFIYFFNFVFFKQIMISGVVSEHYLW